MVLETKIHIDFDGSEQKIINDFLDLINQFNYKGVCEHLSCYNCPLESLCLCDKDLKDAESFIEYLNNNFDT